jgi:hypothetical protein
VPSIRAGSSASSYRPDPLMPLMGHVERLNAQWVRTEYLNLQLHNWTVRRVITDSPCSLATDGVFRRHHSTNQYGAALHP